MAKKKTTNGRDRLKKIEDRLVRLETVLDKQKRIEAQETAVEPWRFLVRRLHPWRKQLYVKGRNLTARQLVGSIQANQMNDEQAAANYRLPSMPCAKPSPMSPRILSSCRPRRRSNG